jgi:Ca2+-transporting ATPase
MDPPARGVHATIARLREAGLRTIMITGDQKRTAQAVGRELGLLGPGDVVMDERELRSLPAAELKNRVRSVAAFSRVAPEDKLAIVRALQENGQVVAMFGDGVNDAPALKQADVGVAMGLRGTDVAKEAAAIVLQDDRFETIAAAVEEGRVIYDNLRKFVFYLFSCNLAEIAVLLGAAVAGLPTPLLPIQILWMNIVTDTFPALALAMEPGDPDVMRRPPKHPEDTVLSGRFLREIAAYGGLIAAASLAAFEWALVYDPAHAGTVAFMTLSLAQILHLGNARSAEPVLSLSRARANRYAVAAVILSGALQTVGTENRWVALPLGVDRLDAGAWVAVALFSAVPAVIGQTAKLVRARKSRRRT